MTQLFSSRNNSPARMLLVGLVVTTVGVSASLALAATSGGSGTVADDEVESVADLEMAAMADAMLAVDEDVLAVSLPTDERVRSRAWWRRPLRNIEWLWRWRVRIAFPPPTTAGGTPDATAAPTTPHTTLTAPATGVPTTSPITGQTTTTTTAASGSASETSTPRPAPVTSAPPTQPPSSPSTQPTSAPPTQPPSSQPTQPPSAPSVSAPATSAPATPAPSTPANGNGVYRVTNGSGGATAWDSSSPPEAVSSHGSRVYCVVSHFSHDDPVVFPRQTGAAHAHMFWGNTGADAFSTGDSLMASGNSSCEGGITNRSSYWMPALFNSSNEAVLPETVFVYYKSFGAPAFDRSTIKPIPAGLEMLATRGVNGAGDWDFRVDGDQNGTTLKMIFPSCVAVDGRGNPILNSGDNVSHLSYPTENNSPNGCPSSHPYRIPTVSYVVTFAVPFDSGWYLSSDESTATKGQSLHADYIAAWDADTMDQLVECTIVARRSCEFPGRAQLPERFLTPEGTQIYEYSVRLTPEADRTPFGTRITKMAR